MGFDFMNNITARANVLYSIMWTAQADVSGWRGIREPFVFKKGTSYHLPYGRPINCGKIIFSGAMTEKTVSIENFLSASADKNSIYYKERSGKFENNKLVKSSVFYAMDCSAFVSFCWGLPEIRKTRNIKQDDVSFLGKCCGDSINNIEPGDALNLTKKDITVSGKTPHVVLVTRVFDDMFEITEQAPPQLHRSICTKSELEKKYSEFSILRYKFRDTVPNFFE